MLYHNGYNPIYDTWIAEFLPKKPRFVTDF